MNAVTKQYRYIWLGLAVCMYLVCGDGFAEHVNNDTRPSHIIIDDVLIKPMSELSQGECADPSTIDNNWTAIKFTDVQQDSHICIRAKVGYANKLIPENPTLILGSLSSATLYWDGQLLIENGKVAANADNEKPGNVQVLVRLPQPNQPPTEHLLSIEMSNFNVGASLSNVAYALLIIDDEQFNSIILKLSIISVFLMGMLLTLGALFQCLYWLYVKDQAFLTFSLLCLSASALILTEQGKIWFFYSYDWHIWRLLLVLSLTFLTSFLLPVFYLLYYRQKYTLYLSALIFVCLTLLSIFVTGFETKSLTLFGTSLTVCLLINLVALRNNKKTALMTIFLLGISILSAIAMPFLFTEFGFAGMLALLMPAMLISLIKEMKTQRDKALTANRIQGELLRKNLQPHFLMNSLTHVMEMIEVEPNKAVTFVADLANEFRLLVKSCSQPVISLEQEIKLCQLHLQIMSARYLTDYTLEVLGEVNDVNVPSAILHSQIENCFTHNRISANRHFTLDVERRINSIKLSLKTPIETATSHNGTGIGDAYVKAKLNETCHNGWHFHCEVNLGYWVTTITYRISGE